MQKKINICLAIDYFSESNKLIQRFLSLKNFNKSILCFDENSFRYYKKIFPSEKIFIFDTNKVDERNCSFSNYIFTCEIERNFYFNNYFKLDKKTASNFGFFLEKFIKEHSVNFFFGEPRANFYSIITENICTKKGILYISVHHSSRFNGYEEWHIVNGKKLNINIKHRVDFNILKKTFNQPPKYFNRLIYRRKIDQSSLFKSINYMFINFTNLDLINYFYREIIKIRIYHIFFSFRNILDKFFIYSSFVPFNSYYVYATAKHPEASTASFSFGFSDEINNILNVLKALPVGSKLIVARHRMDRGRLRFIDQLKLKKLGVLFVDDKYDRNKLITNSKACVTVNSSITNYFVYLKKPVYLLGFLRFKSDLIMRVNSFYELEKKLNESISFKNPNLYIENTILDLVGGVKIEKFIKGLYS